MESLKNGNVSLKVLEKSWNFLFKKGYEPCTVYFVHKAVSQVGFFILERKKMLQVKEKENYIVLSMLCAMYYSQLSKQKLH